MDITKTNIIMERFLLKNAIKLEEERQVSDYLYSKYHAKLASDYRNILTDLEDFVGYDSSNQDEDFTEYVSRIKLDRDKPEDSFRKKYGNSQYLRALGETASYYFRDKINNVIESIILPNQPTNSALDSLYNDGICAYEQPFKVKSIPVIDLINPRQLEFFINKKISNYEVTLVKPVEQLEYEQAYLIKAFSKLASEAEDETTKNTYKRYGRYASYIYEFYISISTGKQLIMPRLSNDNIKTLESSRRYTKEQQLIEVTRNNKLLLDYFKDIQKNETDSFDKDKVFRL